MQHEDFIDHRGDGQSGKAAVCVSAQRKESVNDGTPAIPLTSHSVLQNDIKKNGLNLIGWGYWGVGGAAPLTFNS